MNLLYSVAKLLLALLVPPLLASVFRSLISNMNVSNSDPYMVLCYTASQLLVFLALWRMDGFAAMYHGTLGLREVALAVGFWLVAFSAWYPLNLLFSFIGLPTQSSWGWWTKEGFWFIPIALWAIGAAFFEEAFFRGYAISQLTNLLRSPIAALLISSVAFGLLHGRFGIFLSVYTFVFGLVAGLLYFKTRSTWACFVYHLVNNLIVDFVIYK